MRDVPTLLAIECRVIMPIMGDLLIPHGKTLVISYIRLSVIAVLGLTTRMASRKEGFGTYLVPLVLHYYMQCISGQMV
jgi:hypothetical protein